MAAQRRTPPGVFDLEGPWSTRLTDTSTVRPLLEVLDGRKAIRFIHRDAATIPEFETYMLQWTQQQYRNYGLGYLAFHGEAGALKIGRKWYSLESLSELLRRRLAGRTLYFGSCETLDIDLSDAERFLKATGARAVCGYTSEIDWIESAAFELNLIHAVTSCDRIDAGFKSLQRNHSGACAQLGLRAVWKGGAVWE